MTLHAHHTIDSFQREALISLTVLFFIEENSLLTAEQLVDARRSLQALFLRTSSEETLLRKLIHTLRTTKRIHESFSRVAKVVEGIHKSTATLEQMVAKLRAQVEEFKVSAEETNDFMGPFLDFSQAFLYKTTAFSRNVDEHLKLREDEARWAGIHHIAHEAREKLRQRLSGALAAEPVGETESKMKRDIVATFDYGEAEHGLKQAKRAARAKHKELVALLKEIHALCQLAKNPKMREKPEVALSEPHADVFVLLSMALRKHPRLLQLKDEMLALFKYYQHAYGIFKLDFENLNKATEEMTTDVGAYFEAKEDDHDIATKKDKLMKIEGLIPFLEHSADLLHDDGLSEYDRFTKRLSELIGKPTGEWTHIGESLLRSKVHAEAELSTRM